MMTCLGESGGLRLGHRQNKYSISTNAPCCIAITFLNRTAHIEILILPLVLLAAKAGVCGWDLFSEKSCFCEAKHADHIRRIHFVFYSSGETCILNNSVLSISKTKATPRQPRTATTSLRCSLFLPGL